MKVFSFSLIGVQDIDGAPRVAADPTAALGGPLISDAHAGGVAPPDDGGSSTQ